MKRESDSLLFSSNRLWLFGALLLAGLLLAMVVYPAAAADGPDAPEAGTDHFGTINTEVAPWTVAGNPHRVTGPLTIDLNGVVKLEPGVIIEIATNTSITVNGIFTMTTATPGDPLVINSGQQANFGKLDFTPTARVALRNCQISNGGGLSEVVSIQSSNVLLENCTLFGNTPTARVILVKNANTNPTLTNVTIRDNLLVPWAIVQDNVNANPKYSNITLSNNNSGQGDALVIALGTNPASVNNGSKVTVNGPAFNGKPVYFENGFNISSGGAITFTAGSLVQLGAGKLGIVQMGANGPGRLTAIGEPTKPITFTSRSGVFAQLQFSGLNATPGQGSVVKLKNCLISQGGVGQNEAVRIMSSDVTIEDCTFRNHAGVLQTIYIGNTNDATSQGLAPILRNVTIENSNGYAIAQRLVDMAPVYDNVLMVNNTPNGVYLGGGTLTRAVTLDQQKINGAPFYAGISPSGLVTVGAGATLTLKNNTQLRLLPGASLVVAGTGTLDARSTDSAQPVSFRAVDDSPVNDFFYWKLIDFQANSIVKLENCQIRHGGGAPQGQTPPAEAIKISSSNVQFNQCTIETNSPSQRVILISGAGIEPTLHNLTIQNNEGFAIVHDNINANPKLNNVTLNNNIVPGGLDGDAYVVGTGGSVQAVTTKVTLDGPSINDSPYYLPNGATINASGVLTFTPDTEVELGLSKLLTVNGRLFAEGTPAALVEIRSKGTGNTFTRLDFSTTAEVSLRYCDVTQGGSVSTEVIRINSSKVSIQDCTIHDNTLVGVQTQAIYLGGSATKLTPTLRNLTIRNNNGYGIAQSSVDMGPVYENILMTGNTLDGIFLASGTTTFDLVLNVDQINGSPYYGNNIVIPAGKSLTLTPGTELRLLPASTIDLAGTFVAVGTPARHVRINSNKAAPTTGDYWKTFLVRAGSSLTLDYCEIAHAGNGANFAVDITSPTVLSINNTLISQSGVLNNTNILALKSTITTMRNIVVMDNIGSALYLSTGSNLTARHFTIARNTFAGVFVLSTARINLTNSILAANGTAGVLNSAALSVDGGGIATTTRNLWDSNTPAIANRGTHNASNDLDGFARFAWDGYHITRYSDALNLSQSSTLTDDYDGESRPLPAGSVADLGADEYVYAFGSDFAVEKGAYAPKWVVDEDGLGAPLGFLRQQYALRFFLGTPGLTPSMISITDTLPGGMSFENETHSPAMQFQQGADLTWQTEEAVVQGESGLITFSSRGTPAAGSKLLNQGLLQAGALSIPFGAESSVPVFAPVIYSPGAGELCSGDILIRGAAQPGASVTLFAGATQLTQVTADSAGLFSFVYPYPGGSVALTAKACFGPSCTTSAAVNLTSATSFWCPQRSSWNATPTSGDLAGQDFRFAFRNNSGNFAANGWSITAAPGTNGTTLNLVTCNCPGSASAPNTVRATVNGVEITPSGSHPNYTFNIPYSAGAVTFSAICDGNPISSSGSLLSPLAGLVYDVSQGNTHPTQGVTVTAMISLPQWGGWVPFPAALYGGSTSQVSGANGAFAFQVPPGLYYLQAAATPGYQAWRSPAVQVTNGLLTAQIPYTPESISAQVVIELSPTGNLDKDVQVILGQTVEWRVKVDPLLTPAALISQLENPRLRVLSTLLPGINPHAFDSGMLAVGSSYRRTFVELGEYTYSDGSGHSGKIVVVDTPLAGLVVTNNGPVQLGQAMTFDVSVTSGSNPVFTWNFDDGSPAQTGAVVQHTYATIGSYDVTVTAQNSNNSLNGGTTAQVVDVPVSALQGQHSSPAYVGRSVAFTATVGTGSNVVYTWDFGAVNANGAHASHIYAAPGTYTVTLSAQNGTNLLSVELEVNVVDVPISGLMATASSPAKVDQPVTFNASVSAGTNVVYTWDFDDGSPVQTGANVQHTFSTIKSYTVTVTATNGSGFTTQQVIVDVQKGTMSLYLPITRR